MSDENEPPLQKGEIGIVIRTTCDHINVGEEVLVLEGLQTRAIRDLYTGESRDSFCYTIQTNKPFFWCGIENYNMLCVNQNALKRKKLPPLEKSQDTDTDAPNTLSSWNDPFWKEVGVKWQHELVEVEPSKEIKKWFNKYTVITGE